MGFLDQRVFRLDDPLAVELLEALKKAYDRGNRLRQFADEAGMELAAFRWDNDSASALWYELLRTAAAQGRLRQLIEAVERDESSSAHTIFRTLVDDNEPVPFTTDERLLGLGRIVGGPALVAGLPPQDLLVHAPLPRRVPGFVGRSAELDAIRRWLRPGPGRTAATVLVGAPGIGKTSLAGEAGHAARERGWASGGVYFVDMLGYGPAPVSAGQVLDLVLRGLGVAADQIPETVAGKSALYRVQLDEVSGPVLIVADNVHDAGQVEPLLLDPASPHRVLVTSRSELALSGIRVIRIGQLSETEAIALLTEGLYNADPADERIAAHPDQAARIVNYCDRLPLALGHVLARLTIDGLSAAAIADALEDQRARLIELDDREHTVHGIRAAFGLSYQSLDDQAARLFRLLGVSPLPEISQQAATAISGLEEPAAARALTTLAREHLIVPVEDRRRWRMHDLIHAYAREQPDGNREAALDRFLEYMCTSAKELYSAPISDAVGSGPQNLITLRRLMSWSQVEHLSLVAAAEVAAETGRDAIAAELCAHGWALTFGLGQFATAGRLAELGIDVAVRLADPVLEVRARIGFTWSLQIFERNTAQAVSAAEDALALARAQVPHLTDVIWLALLTLASVYRKAQRRSEALAVLQEAVELSRTAGALDFEAVALMHVVQTVRDTENSDESAAIAERVLALAHQSMNPMAIGLAQLTLTSTLTDIKEYRRALAIALEARETFHAIDSRLMEVLAIGAVADLWNARGKHRRALPLREQALALAKESLDHQGQAEAWWNLADELRSAKRKRRAAKAFREAAEAYRAAGDGSNEARSLQSYAFQLRRRGRWRRGETAEILSVFQRAADRALKAGNTRTAAFALFNLADTLRSLGRLREALRLYRQALDMLRSACDESAGTDDVAPWNAIRTGRTRLQTLVRKEKWRDIQAAVVEISDRAEAGLVLKDLGYAYQNAGRSAQSLEALSQAERLLRDAGDRRGRALALNGLGNALNSLKRLDEAMTRYGEARNEARTIGYRHAEGIAGGNIAMALLAAGRDVEALEAASAAADVLRQTGDHSSEGWILQLTARALANSGRDDEALEHAAAAVALLEPTNDDRELLEGFALLGQILVRLGRYDEARTIFTRGQRLGWKRDEGRAAGLMFALNRQTARLQRKAVRTAPPASSPGIERP